MRRVQWLVLWSLWASRLLPPSTAPLRLRDGLLRGRLAPDGSHATYLGIPYASVRRFQAPGPAARWRGVFEAVDEHVRCAQRWPGGLVVGREHCLRLNVYVPLPRASAALPVMVFIHGGGFYEGSGSRLLYGPDYLVTKGVVLVTFNYRLAAPGFMCLRTREIPGNAAMKDQVAALRWVRDNIAAFGGDPDDVTIFGESAGAASVSYHMVSPMSRGLFHKAIVQSGSMLAQWALQRDGADTAVRAARALGRDVHRDDVGHLHAIFMNATIEELLLDPIPRKDGSLILQHLPFTPCVEKEIDGVEAFITETPYDTLSKGTYNKVPVVIGFNDREGYYFTALEDNSMQFRNVIERTLPDGLCFPTQRMRDETLLEIKRMYLGNDSIAESSILELAQFYGEVYVTYPVLAQTELLLATSSRPVFSYQMAYAGWRNLAKLWSGPRFWLTPGATHGDELMYLFSQFPLPVFFEGAMIRTMTTMWTDFAKYGVPGAAWPALEARAPRSLHIGQRLRRAPLWPAQLRHWRRLHRRYSCLAASLRGLCADGIC